MNKHPRVSACPSRPCSAVLKEGWDNSVLLYGHSVLLSGLLHVHQDGLKMQETFGVPKAVLPAPLPWTWGSLHDLP